MTISSEVEVKQVRLVTGTGSQIASARQAGEILDTDLVVQIDAPESATAEQGALADTALQPGDNITELVNNADYATNTQVGSAVSNHNTSESAHSYIQGLISSEESRAEGVEGTLSNLTTSVKNNLVSAINEIDSHADTNASNISDIRALIPNDASTNNQLADKGFVNSSIATNTANFIGTFNSVAELEAYSGTPTNNDYAFVIGTDSAGNTVYDRYKYTDATTPASWVFEYELNNSSFTADQWAAINSLATTNKIAQITTNQNAIGTLSSLTTTTKTDLVSAINELDSDKLDKNTAITGATKCKITYDGKGLVTGGADLSASDIPSLTLSKISDITATASELNILDGITASTTELNYTDGVTSNIQTQLNGKVSNTRTINGKALSSNITLNAGDIGALPNSTAIPSKTSDLTNDSGFISGITSLMVTTALGYTPYNSSNPAGYISGITSAMVTTALGYIPYNSSNPSGYISGITSAMVTTALGYTPQQQLVSGTNIKTINNNSILGSGNLEIDGLPSQTSNAGKFLTTDGTDASWGVPKTHDLFDNKWTDHLLNDQNWLRADTFSWQDGTVYTNAYSHLVADMVGISPVWETVGSYQVAVYNCADGHKICTPDQETNVANIYNESGVAWYYILDTTNTRFKLPRTKYGFVGLRDAVGKYVPESLPNIKGETSTYSCIFAPSGTTGAFLTGVTGNDKTQAGSGSGFSYQFKFDASNYSSVYQDDVPVQQRATQMYLYFYVGQYSQTAIEQTAGLNSELFNNKADVDLNNINSTGKAKLGPTVYEASGLLVNQGSGSLEGYGKATVYLYKNGIAEVHFNVKITTTGTGSTSFDCGINSNLLTQLNANIPTITPTTGGSLIYCATDGTVSNDRMEYGGTLIHYGQFWEPARVYTTAGGVGGWPASNLVAGQRLIGVCYGTYTV